MNKIGGYIMAIRLLNTSLLILLSLELNAASVRSFAGSIVIPDGNPSGIDIPLDFSGFNATVSNLSITLDLHHDWIGDLSATLTSPRGEANMVIFSRIGASRDSEFGDSSNFAGIYEFTDRGDDMWLAAAGLGTNDSVFPGTYRTSTAGKPLVSNYGGHRTSLEGVFGDLITGSTGVLGDGIWVLNIADMVSGVSGTVNSVTLSLDASDAIFSNGFEAIIRRETVEERGGPVPLPTNRMDFNGNGLADYGVLNIAESLDWRILDNESNGNTGAETIFNMGTGITFRDIISADFDGDGITDAAIWDDSVARYMIRRSSRPGSPILQVPVGTTGDQSRVVGDYDGDGIIDPATFTNGNATDDPLFLHYVRSSDGLTVSVPMGEDNGVTARILGGHDYTGNGRADLLLATSGNYVVRDGQSGMVVDTFSFGEQNDPGIMIGNFSGDNRSDITRVILSGSDIIWETRETGSGTVLPQVILGELITGFSEFAAQADYDGDGYQDYGVWRRDNAMDNNAQFIYRPSTNTSSTTTVIYGSMLEIPLARTHSD